MFRSVRKKHLAIALVLLVIYSIQGYSLPSASSTTTLSVSVSAPLEVTEGENISISVEITTDNLTDVSLLLETTDGSFGEVSSINEVVSVNGTVTKEYSWIAPINLVDFQDVEINATVSADNLTASDVQTIRVLPIVRGFNLEWKVAENWSQDMLLPIYLLVKDNSSLLPVEGADVSFIADVGTFPNGAVQTTVQTNVSGWASTNLNLSSSLLLLKEQQVSISATVTKDTYEPSEALTTVTVKQVLIPEFTAEIDKVEISRGENVSLSIETTLNSIPWVNATIEATATGGMFSNGETLIRVRTDKNGKQMIVWSSKNLPTLREDTTFVIQVRVVTTDFDLSIISFNVTVKADKLTFSIDTGNTTETPLPLLWIVGGVLVIPLIRRKR